MAPIITRTSTANAVAAPLTVRAAGEAGSPPKAAICVASRLPRVSSNTASAATETTWAARAAYTPAAARLTADDVDRMCSPPAPGV
ncbi:hypothetical protein Misp03_68320 [Microbispora sp. NBRC 16548]|nr:hypothetical protein Misp03_68320 [Microbispora sp. NBRC 16548]